MVLSNLVLAMFHAVFAVKFYFMRSFEQEQNGETIHEVPVRERTLGTRLSRIHLQTEIHGVSCMPMQLNQHLFYPKWNV